MIDWKRHCAAVIPCFNEATTIASVVTGVKAYLPHVFVIDDGSDDGTARLAAEAGARVISLPCNSGKGAALRAGWKEARRLDFEWVMLLDGDGQHAPSDIPRFLEHAETAGATLVVGNRMENADAIPPLRRFVNRWMSRRISRWTGISLPDSQCGFRLAHLQTLSGLTLSADHFEVESEMLLAFLAARQKIGFVPVETIYKNSASKIHPVIDTARWFRWQFSGNRRRISGAVTNKIKPPPALDNVIVVKP